MAKTLHSAEHRRQVQLLRELRESSGLRQVDLAERLDRPQSFVRMYEAGERRLDLIELRAICMALDASVVELVQRWEAGK